MNNDHLRALQAERQCKRCQCRAPVTMLNKLSTSIKCLQSVNVTLCRRKHFVQGCSVPYADAYTQFPYYSFNSNAFPAQRPPMAHQVVYSCKHMRLNRMDVQYSTMPAYTQNTMQERFDNQMMLSTAEQYAPSHAYAQHPQVHLNQLPYFVRTLYSSRRRPCKCVRQQQRTLHTLSK